MEVQAIVLELVVRLLRLLPAQTTNRHHPLHQQSPVLLVRRLETVLSLRQAWFQVRLLRWQ